MYSILRALVGILLFFLYCIGLTVRAVFEYKLLQLAIAAAIIIYISGCASVIDRDPRACYREAYTVADITACTEKYKPWEPGLTDKIAQPIGELERILN